MQNEFPSNILHSGQLSWNQKRVPIQLDIFFMRRNISDGNELNAQNVKAFGFLWILFI